MLQKHLANNLFLVLLASLLLGLHEQGKTAFSFPRLSCSLAVVVVLAVATVATHPTDPTDATHTQATGNWEGKLGSSWG